MAEELLPRPRPYSYTSLSSNGSISLGELCGLPLVVRAYKDKVGGGVVRSSKGGVPPGEQETDVGPPRRVRSLRAGGPAS